MFAPKDYLLVEWANVERTLRETLRYRYTERDTSEYYKECASRLKYVRHLLKSVAPSDERGIRAIASRLHDLSDLITRVERSHLEEFSWPFAHALKRISADVCKEGPLAKLAKIDPPLFFFTAEGGICSYAVRPEVPAPGLVGQKIYSVVFPRTLKDSVLLHAIIGHEIGHAAIATQEVSLRIRAIVDKLISGSVVEDIQQLFDWCKANIGVTERVCDSYLQDQRLSWAEEFYCDLFGLVAMGPSFLPAFQALLQPLSTFPAGKFVPSHPPFAARIVALVHAARALNILYSEEQPPNDLDQLSKALDKSFLDVAAGSMSGASAILNPSRVAEAALELKRFALDYQPLAFPFPDTQMISQLIRSLEVHIPPVGRYPAASKPGASQPPEILPNEVVDFRHILLAGWLHWSRLDKSQQDEKAFAQINNLCSHAILQQEGLLFWNAGSKLLASRTP